MVIRLILGILVFLSSAPLIAGAAQLEAVVDEVVHQHMAEKRIPGISVAIVQDGAVVFSKGYGKASLEFDVPASPSTVYPISSVSKILAGLLAVRMVEAGKLDLDASVTEFFDEVPPDKELVTVRHLLQHTHGLDDFYRSEDYPLESGKTVDTSTAIELVRWSLNRPARFSPGTAWEYSLAGYVMLAQIFEYAGGMPYEELLGRYVLEPVGMVGTFGGSESVVANRNPVLYELVDNELSGHIVDFQKSTYAAGGFNTSVEELSKLFIALSDNDFIDGDSKRELWNNLMLENGSPANYGLGWFSYTTSKSRWVVGHEGGGASWVIYYPDLDLAVIALSNMSGARADSLPYEIARGALAGGLLRSE
jgi:CubicO group peptidase (beta-lactamase class C family)